MNDDFKVIIYISTLFFLVILFFVFVLVAIGDDIPYCEEDEVIAGRGEYKDGYWDRYVCIDGD
jgi:hypothetical protein